MYRSEPRSPSLAEAGIVDLCHLGPTLIDAGVNFGVYSEHATRVELVLFDDPEAAETAVRLPMQRFGDVWNVYVEGLRVGQHYGYVAWGPNWPHDPRWAPGSLHGFVADVDAAGNRFNPNKLLFDPYSKAIHRDHDWSRGSAASGPARAESTWAAAAKSIVAESRYRWSAAESAWREARAGGRLAGHGWNELIIYEVHAKGFTAARASGVRHPGTYRGFGEKADYLADLGVNAVELLPLFAKARGGGYWGYQTLSFFAPESTYASRGEEAIDELKWMVDELHQRGIEVLLDVVYNHTGEGGLWPSVMEQDDSALDPRTDAQLAQLDPTDVAALQAYRGLDNSAYYALSPDGRSYWNNSGVGQQTRPNHRPMRRLIMDSLRYWVEEMHVDGFRFDLAPVLGERDRDYDRRADFADTIIQEIIDDPVLRRFNTRIIAEPWSVKHFRLGEFPKSTGSVAWYEWNGHFRDVWRSFVNFEERALSAREGPLDLGAALTGSRQLFGARRPYHSVNFITVHDGFTLYDLFSFAAKVNGCGLLNPRCCSEPYRPYCDRGSGEDHNRSRDWHDEPQKRALMRAMFTALMLSHGTPMLLGGDEWMRTQFGNNNAYSSGADNPWNWLDWGTWDASCERHRMHDFVRSLARLRREHAALLAPADYDGVRFAWKRADNSDMTPADWSRRHVMQHYWEGPRQLLVLINMESVRRDFTLPTGRVWARLIDTQPYWDLPERFGGAADPRRSLNATLDEPERLDGASYGVMPRSIVVLESRAPDG